MRSLVQWNLLKWTVSGPCHLGACVPKWGRGRGWSTPKKVAGIKNMPWWWNHTHAPLKYITTTIALAEYDKNKNCFCGSYLHRAASVYQNWLSRLLWPTIPYFLLQDTSFSGTLDFRILEFSSTKKILSILSPLHYNIQVCNLVFAWGRCL